MPSQWEDKSKPHRNIVFVGHVDHTESPRPSVVSFWTPVTSKDTSSRRTRSSPLSKGRPVSVSPM